MEIIIYALFTIAITVLCIIVKILSNKVALNEKWFNRRFERMDIERTNLYNWQIRHDTNYITIDSETTERDSVGNFVISGLMPNKRNIIKVKYPEGNFPLEKIFEINI